MTTVSSHDQRLSVALRDAGMRVTSQRLVLYRVLQELGTHATAEEIASRAADRLPGLSLPTVYATLDVLERLGLVRRVSTTTGTALFDPRIEAHEHFVCDSCGRVIDVPARTDTARAASAARRAGLHVEHVDVVLHGHCADCA
jgi:Fur family ferric uptake transcriptional regulator/Fur family peroxide stress response transcriptional regulator